LLLELLVSLQQAQQALEVLRYSSLQSTLKAFGVNICGKRAPL
jgi:hypothetical protein